MYEYWVRTGKKPPGPTFIEEVMTADKVAEDHLFWIEDVISYLQDRETYGNG